MQYDVKNPNGIALGTYSDGGARDAVRLALEDIGLSPKNHPQSPGTLIIDDGAPHYTAGTYIVQDAAGTRTITVITRSDYHQEAQ